MAVDRTPAAWVADYRMSKNSKPILFVEGVSDEWFWKKFIEHQSIQLRQVRGWENVVKIVREFNREGLSTFCIGIIDRDFESLHPHKSISECNIFLSDLHDIEMMMYQSPAWAEAMPAIAKKITITDEPSKVLATAISFTDKIGYLRLTSFKNSMGLHFKNQKKNGKIELPNYERTVMDKNGEYTNDAELIRYIREYTNSINKGSETIPDQKQISEKFEEESQIPYDSLHLSNGHDLTYVMKWMLKRKYNSETTEDMIESCLHAAYSVDILKNTELYKSIYDWSEAHKVPIFKTKAKKS